jgi:uncharacterized coiled-coil DUF342 family protein
MRTEREGWERERTVEEQLRKRVDELKAEFEKGTKKLETVEAEAAELRKTLLRISGAIQVLEEELERSAMADTRN